MKNELHVTFMWIQKDGSEYEMQMDIPILKDFDNRSYDSQEKMIEDYITTCFPFKIISIVRFYRK